MAKKLSGIRQFNLIKVFLISIPILLVVLLLNQRSPALRFQIIVVASSVYLILAILHHLKNGTLTLEIVLEYILIAALSLAVMQSVSF